MKVLVLTQNLIPYPTGFGSAIHVWSLIECLLSRGHEVDLCCYGFNAGREKAHWVDGDYRRTLDELSALNVRTYIIDGAVGPADSAWAGRLDLLRRAINPQVSDFYEGPAFAPDLRNLIDETAPDAICAWTVDAVAATDALHFGIPRLAFLTDLDHLGRRHRRRFRPARTLRNKLYQFADAMSERRLPSVTTELLSDCEIVVDHAAHHCAWLREHGVAHATYLAVPVLDRAGSAWEQSRRDALSRNDLPRISLVGNVTGAATLPGLQLLADEILPEMERRIGADGFEVHIIGGGKLPPKLARDLDKRYVKVRGYVDDIHEEFRRSDIFLVPTPIDLGFRTRIAEGFSFGCCVVAHQANALGMPELRHADNAMLADTGPELARYILQILESPALRERLGAAGRATFEAELDGQIVCGKMIDSLESLVSNSAPHRASLAGAPLGAHASRVRYG